MAWRLEAIVGGRSVRAASGDWLNPKRGDRLESPIPLTRPPWAGGSMESRGSPEDLELLARSECLEFDFDLLQGSKSELIGLLGELIPGKVAGAIADASVRPPRSHHTRTPLPDIALDGASPLQQVDLLVSANPSKESWACGVRSCTAFIGPSWLITVWAGFVTPDQVPGAPTARIAEGNDLFLSFPSRDSLLDDSARSGLELLDRLLVAIVRHHTWTLQVVAEGLVDWETDFFERHGSPSAIRLRMDELARLGQCVACVNYAGFGMVRRAEFDLVIRSGSARDEVMRRGRETLENARITRREVRECFALAGNAARAADAVISEQRAESIRRFEFGAGVVTAFVLVPGLVIGFYGANVDGLPGQNNTSGLLYMALLAVASGIITIGLLVRAMRSTRGYQGEGPESGDDLPGSDSDS